MKHRWQITKDDEKGLIIYDETTWVVDVDFPVPAVFLEVQDYLVTEHAIMYPFGPDLDQDYPKQELPTKSLSNMQMVLSGLMGATGVMVRYMGPVK